MPHSQRSKISAEPAEAIRNARLTVLCVDDEDSKRYVRSRILTAAGFQVIEAEDGAAALRLAAETQPSLIVLDVRLPDVNGFEVCEQLKSDARTRAIPILHISAVGAAEEDLPEALEHHSDAYLHEPVEAKTLVATARALVRAREAERRQEAAEERARAAEKSALRLVESLADPVLAFDDRWRCTYSNGPAAELFGKATEEMTGVSVWEIMPAEARAEFESACRRAWSDNRPAAREHYFEAAGRWFESYIHPFDGGACAQWRDITEHKRAEQALQESEVRYRRLFESMQEGYVIGEPICNEAGEPVDWKYLDVNPAMLKMLGGAREEVIGHTYRELYPNPQWQYWARGFGEVALSGKPALLEGFGGGTGLDYVATVHCPAPGQFAAILTDVTERKRAEEAARKNREWLRVTLSSIGDAVVATDADGRVTFLNEVAASLTGWSEQEAIGRPAGEIFRIIHEDSGAPADDVVGRVLREGRVIPLANHTALVRRGGEVIPVEDSAAPIRTDAGEILGVVVVFHDVTLERRAEQALRESEAQFRTLANAIPQLCWMANADGWIFWYNDRWYEYTGATRKDMEGWGWQSAHDPEALPGVLEQWKASIATGKPFEMVFPLRGADGVFRPFLTRIVPLLDAAGKVSRWFGTNTDITEQRRTEEALRASETRERARAAELNALLDAAPAAMFLAQDPECRSIIGSRTTYEMFGVAEGTNLSPSGPTGALPSGIRVLRNGREVRERDMPMQRAAATGQAVRNYQFELEYADGSRRHMLGDAAPLLDEAGRPRGAVGAFLDVTEIKRNEERLRQAQKLESVGLLAGGIAHDFNNLLTGILGNASMLEGEVAPAAAERVAEVMKAAQRAADLTRQLLAYSGKGQFIVRELDVSTVVNEISSLVEFSIPRSAQLAVSVERRLPPVRMDPSQLQQILMNLVINAGEAIGEGNPGRIQVSTSLADVEQGFEDALGEPVESGRYVRIEVSDTGPGMDDATRARIFDPFFTTKFTGRGLGLAAVSGILRAQGGAITLETAPGRGAKFRVFLPAADDREVSGGTRTVQGASTGTVLVVDDEPTVRDFLGAVLRKRGYHVVLAADGREALSVARRETTIDAIILDVVMPVMGARDALPKLKREMPAAKVLLTSGYSEAEARRLCAEYPGAAFLQKPYTAQRLARVVQDLIAGRAATGLA